MRKIIAVMSGKGGVGKSSVAAMLAQILSEKFKTIILDFDLCGPSITTALGLKGGLVKCNSGFVPVNVTKSLDALSLGVSLKPEDAVIWRGPRKKSFLELFYESSQGYDYVIIDTPPGISEEHDFLSSKGSSVLIVSTPQNVALNDTQRCIEFCQKNNIEILGLIENMSFLKCECCEEIYYPFGTRGGESLAEEYNIKFLGKLEIDPEWSKTLDDGSFVDCYRHLKTFNKFVEILKSIELL